MAAAGGHWVKGSFTPAADGAGGGAGGGEKVRVSRGEKLLKTESDAFAGRFPGAVREGGRGTQMFSGTGSKETAAGWLAEQGFKQTHTTQNSIEMSKGKQGRNQGVRAYVRPNQIVMVVT